jgi:hypothetical protein
VTLSVHRRFDPVPVAINDKYIAGITKVLSTVVVHGFTNQVDFSRLCFGKTIGQWQKKAAPVKKRRLYWNWK